MRNPRLINFNDGEGLDHNDLNDLQTRLGYKHSDVLYYPMSIDRLGYTDSGGSGPFWQDIYATPSNFLDRATFFVGSSSCRPKTVSGLQKALQGGTLAIYNATIAPVITGENFLFFALEDGDGAVTLASNSGGGADRYDVVVISGISVGTNDTQSRDFKDATTGALSSSSVDKGRTIDPIFSVIQGTPGAGVPAITAGNHPVAIWRITTSDTTEMWTDPQYPLFGQLELLRLNSMVFPPDVSAGASFTTGYRLTTSAASKTLRFPLPISAPFRLMSMYLDYNFTTTAGLTFVGGAYGLAGTEHTSSRHNFHTDIAAHGASGTLNWIFDPVNPIGVTPSTSLLVQQAAYDGLGSGWTPQRIDANRAGLDILTQGFRAVLPTSGDYIDDFSVTILKY